MMVAINCVYFVYYFLASYGYSKKAFNSNQFAAHAFECLKNFYITSHDIFPYLVL